MLLGVYCLRNVRGTKSFTKIDIVLRWYAAYLLVPVTFVFINCFDHLQWISCTSSWYPSVSSFGKKFGTPSNISCAWGEFVSLTLHNFQIIAPNSQLMEMMQNPEVHGQLISPETITTKKIQLAACLQYRLL
jgi:hypothetical protein